MSNFKPGDKVQVVSATHQDECLIGLKGYVIRIDDSLQFPIIVGLDISSLDEEERRESMAYHNDMLDGGFVFAPYELAHVSCLELLAEIE